MSGGEIRAIATDVEYAAALERINALIEIARPGTLAGAEFDALVNAVVAYERRLAGWDE